MAHSPALSGNALCRAARTTRVARRAARHPGAAPPTRACAAPPAVRLLGSRPNAPRPAACRCRPRSSADAPRRARWRRRSPVRRPRSLSSSRRSGFRRGRRSIIGARSPSCSSRTCAANAWSLAVFCRKDPLGRTNSWHRRSSSPRMPSIDSTPAARRFSIALAAPVHAVFCTSSAPAITSKGSVVVHQRCGPKCSASASSSGSRRAATAPPMRRQVHSMRITLCTDDRPAAPGR